MRKSELKRIVANVVEMNNTETDIWLVKDITAKRELELGRTVIYIKSKEINRHRFGKSYWKETEFKNEYIFVEETGELLTKDWELIA
jgi:hypothetical protein